MRFYIDPGTGSMLFAILIGIIGAVTYMLKSWLLKLRFVLSYMGANGRTARQTYTSNDFTTSPTEMTTIKVASGFQFPVSNFYDSLWLMDDANDESAKTCTTTLFVQTNVSNSEFNSNKFVRRFRIDRIYLVPSEL